jgi:hypothetical protein
MVNFFKKNSIDSEETTEKKINNTFQIFNCDKGTRFLLI